MTAFDILVLTLLAGGAILGFLNGFVYAAVSLIAWVAGIFALRLFHAPVTALLKEPVGNDSGAAALALVGLYLGVYLIGKLIATSLRTRTRKSMLGPIDRVLGFGFGAVKGLILATLAYLLITMLHDIVWPGEGQPQWVTDSRTFPLLNASGTALVDLYDYQQSLGDE
ncbi:CvpA family protein [Sphingomonas sp. 35-24ZXX]|uniref:CvpA family protein n=1 Tax=Sphingomonas sp. 35-24ZXX TaxID=1545915 RepID=UPI00053BE862|nr:CvpA family protein [Sphingomonas sp. 35-24ZXX]